MAVSTMSLFFALLALAANVATVLVILAAVGRGGVARRLRDLLVEAVGDSALWLAFVAALTSTLGSLYMSEVAHFVPCTLCWYQRIAMYPLVVLFGIAAWRRDRGIRLYGAVLAAIGAAISTYHYLLQRYPSLDAGSCSLGVPCTTAWVQIFGFVTIPYMAFSGFTLILAVLWIDRYGRNDAGPSSGTGEQERP